MSTVVAVAGPTGSGKSTLVRGLAGELPGARALHMDDYERMTRRPLDEVARWAERGADFDELEVPGLAERLRRLKDGPGEYVVFETQFGRAHRATGALIDLLVWIDLPLELALARKLKDFSAAALREPAGDARARLEWLDGYLAGYLALVRRLLVVQAARVRPHADLIVDGTSEPAALVRLVRERLVPQ